MSDTKAGGGLPFKVEVANTIPDGSWVTRPVADSVTEAMEKAPMGAMFELVYASLARRLKKLLDPDGPAGMLLTDTLVPTAINFRALNPTFLANGGRSPTQPPNAGAGAGSYHSAVHGLSHDERLPSTAPLPTPVQPYVTGMDPGIEANKGLLIAHLFADLQSHLPCVLFNVTSNQYLPIGIGGSSVTRRAYKDGIVISELGYRKILTVEATAVTESDNDTAHLMAIIEAAFGTLRDQVDFGSFIGGKAWQLLLPPRISPSNVSEVDAPWSNGDDKTGKLYTATVGLEDMLFECFARVGRKVSPLLSTDYSAAGGGEAAYIALAGETGSYADPIKLKLGHPARIVVNGAPVTSDLAISQAKRVIEIRRPNRNGHYEIVPKRTGEATILLYDTGATVSAQSSQPPAGRVGDPIVQRKVIVSAV